MFRLSEELAKELLKKIKTPKIISSGENAFTYKDPSVGLIDPTCAIGADFPYLIESPVPILYPDLPYIKNGISAYFLYRREELQPLREPWEIVRTLVDPNTKDYEEKLDCSDCAILIPSDIEKLVAPTVSTLEQLLTKEPALAICLNLNKK